jgi:hypothetical protein
MNNKEIIKMALPSIYFIVIIYIVYTFVAIKGMFSLLFIIVFLTMFKDFLPILVKNAKSYVKLTITILCFFLLIRFLGLYGLIGFIATILLLAGYKIYKSRQFFMETIRNLETMIFGKPLDKKKESDDIIDIEVIKNE